MTVVRLTVRYPDGTPFRNAVCHVGIVGTGLVGDGSLILGISSPLTDANGLAAPDLAPSPPGTYYVWTNPDDAGEPHQLNFRVPSGSGPFNLGDILVATPGTSAFVIGGASSADLAAVYAASPDLIASGAITRSTTGAATGFAVAWPDGATGTFAGTESTGFPGVIDAYTVTHTLAGVTRTYTQPALTRDATGAVTNRPSMTVA
jgi:hypothetical protein